MTLATFWCQATPGTTYWRGEIPMRHLPGQVLHLTFQDAVLDEHGEPFMPRQKGAAIWQFPGNMTRATLMELCRDTGHPVLVELDDSYLKPPPPMPYWKSAWQTQIDRSGDDRHSHQIHRKIVRDVADRLIVSTDELANQYAAATDVPIFVCPNSVDLDDWPDPLPREGDVFRIGYAGSDSHRFDITIVDRAMDWAWRQDGVKLVKLGLGNHEWRFPHDHIPWANSLEEYRQNLINAKLDVGLCPLKRGEWHDCKSDVKAIEYTLSGALPIVQADSPCYADWIDLVPSASTEKQWEKEVKWAVNNPDEVREVWSEAWDFVMCEKLIGHHIHRWKEAIR